ncbi:hypothetical protein BC940DRAFT_301069 [Gongronella butleri]|nr:hypothetical protein BC940DRAFT_301069 [Gongronella butleri]
MPFDFFLNGQDWFQFVTPGTEATMTAEPAMSLPVQLSPAAPQATAAIGVLSQQAGDLVQAGVPAPAVPNSSVAPGTGSLSVSPRNSMVSDVGSPSSSTSSRISQQKQPLAPNGSSEVHKGKKRKTMGDTDDEPLNQTVFTLIVGSRTFRLSWESLKSDGPTNFFVNYFRRNRQTRVMYIDRDADTFQLIVHYLRGYYVRPATDLQNQDLLNDARYYGLQRLYKTLQEFLFVNVGGRVFRVSWSLLRKGGKNTFFTGPLQHSLFDPHDSRYQGAPVYIERDPDVFQEIINHLRGYSISIKDETHRRNLLKDAQYYVFRQLTDKLQTATKTVDGFGETSSPEVLLLLQDVRTPNLLPVVEGASGPLRYKREDVPHTLLVQVSDVCLQVHTSTSDKCAPICARIVTMNPLDKNKLRVIGNALKLQKEVSVDRLVVEEDCAITIDDKQVSTLDDLHQTGELCQKCAQQPCHVRKLTLMRGICGLHLMDGTLTLSAVRLELISSRWHLNMKRQFLPQ